MKKINYLLLLVLSFLIFNYDVLADSSKFEATINMEPEITENQINIILGYRGEDVMALSETITYDSTRMKLLDVLPIDNFNVTLGEETIDGKWNTIKLVADSMYSFTDTNYAIAVFEVNDKFKVGKSDDLFIYGIEATGPAKNKFRYRGDYISLNRESLSEMYIAIEPINDHTRMNYFFKNYILIILIIFVVIVGGIIIVILNLPSRRKKEDRSNKVSESLKVENYNPNTNKTNPIKIDVDEINKIGAKQEVIDLNQAIVVSDLKPFNDNPSKEDTYLENNVVENNDVIESQLNDAESMMNVPFDPFNVTPADLSVENVEEINEEEIKNENIEIPKMIDTGGNTIDNEIEEVEDKPVNELQAPIISFNLEESNDDNQDNGDDNSRNNIVASIIILLLLIPTFVVHNVLADYDEETDYRVDDLRDCIVGLIPFDKSLDYNEDGKIDVLDLMETRNLINVNFDELLKTDPGFKELHGQSPNILGQTTTKAIVNKKSTTTRKAVTTSKSNSGSGGSEKKTKTTKTTTAKSTTTRTTKSTTTKEVVDPNQSFNVTVDAVGGSPASSAKSVAYNKNVTFTISPNEGYEYKGVTCSNGTKATYTKTSHSLTVSYVKSDTNCTITFAPRGNLKVSVNVTNGKSSPTYSSVAYGGSTNFTITPNAGYSAANASCSSGSYSLNGNTLSVASVSNDISCNVTCVKNNYTVTVKLNGNVYDTQSVPYNEKYTGTLVLPTNKAKINCDGASVSQSKTQIPDTSSYEYRYSVTVKNNISCNITY